jgi:pyruvate/2-oxoglutarate dehydrogenase complex dihydrolipoamide dehydrogenase (E3) component
VGEVSIDWAAAVARAERIVKGCGDPKPENLAKHGVHLTFGEGHFLDSHTVQVNEERLKANHILIATGRHPPRLPIPGIENAITHIEALRWDRPPRRLAIIGGGIIGMEFAYLFRRLGTEVAVIEMLSQILYMLDDDLRAAITEHATNLGIQIHTSARVQRIDSSGQEYRVEVDRGTELTVDQVMIAAGQMPAVENLQLEHAGVAYDKGGIITDKTLRTNVPNIWAAGDVRKGVAQLSQVATDEGILATRNALLGLSREVDEGIVPFFVGLTPPAASVGLTETEARAAGYSVGVHIQSYAGVCPAANVEGEPEGFVKLLFDSKSGSILGAHAFGTRSPDLIQQVAFALHGRMTIQEAAMTPFVFPGISEVLWYALRPQPGEFTSTE